MMTPESASSVESLNRLRRYIILLAVAIGAFLVFGYTWFTFDARERASDEQRQRLTSLSVAMGAHAESTMRAATSLLRAIQLTIQEGGGLANFREKTLHELFKRHLELVQANDGTPPIHAIWVVPKDGVIKANSIQYPGQIVRVDDRDYFKHHQSSHSPAIYISPLSRSRISGDWAIFLTMRLEDAAGHFAGVLGISVRAAYFQHLYPTLGLEAGDSIVLLRDDGRLLYRYPFNERYTNVELWRDPFFQALAKEREGSLPSHASPYDGTLRIAGFSHGDYYPIYAVVSKQEQTALRPWRRNAIEYALLGAVAYMVILAMCLFSLRQISQLEAAMRVSLLDALTGLPNRRYFDQRMNDEWKRVVRQRQPFSLLFIDIDHFKRYNDHYGHGQGDDCLRRVAHAMDAELMRGGDVLVRFGGEEFVCVLPNTDASGAMRKARAFMGAVARLDLPHADAPDTGRVTVSIGVATVYPGHEDKYQNLLRAADGALYEAKSAGRNRVVSADPRSAQGAARAEGLTD
jgi:diguanylate cyclase (GGDEF)-like protein